MVRTAGPTPQVPRQVVLEAARPPARTQSVSARLVLNPRQRLVYIRWLRHLAFSRWLEGLPKWHYDWDCFAIAETGGDWTMHGSSYSTGLGIMNQAVRENATSEVAARALAGRASKAEQIAIGERIAARFGIRAWAASSVAKCT